MKTIQEQSDEYADALIDIAYIVRSYHGYTSRTFVESKDILDSVRKMRDKCVELERDNLRLGQALIKLNDEFVADGRPVPKYGLDALNPVSFSPSMKNLTQWTDSRAKELMELQVLLNEAKSINHGSGAIDRIQLCERIANALTRADMDTKGESFVQFLRRICCDDRSARLPNAKDEP